MKVNYSCKNGVLKFKFTLEDKEGVDYTGKVKMGRNTCEVRLPKDWTLDSVHPDALALATILIVYPFIGEQMKLSIGVSKEFHKEFMAITGKMVVPIDKSLKARKSPKSARPALSYSGGVDSTVALLLLPENTCGVFIDRVVPREMIHQAVYNKEAAYYACQFLKEQGKTIYKVKTDFEYIRSPRGFSLEFSTSIPALLLADYSHGFDSIASGTIMENVYLEFEEFNANRLYYTNWKSIFDIVDLPRNDVTAGLSNIGTLKILIKDNRYISIAQSCMRGTKFNPCNNCWKCFKKLLIEKVLLGEQLSDKLIDKLFMITEARTFIKKMPIKFENQFAYITAHYDGKHPVMEVLKKTTRGDILAVDWMEKWFSPSSEHIYPKYKKSVEKNIKKYVEVMSREEEETVKCWDTQKRALLKEYKQNHGKFLEELIKMKKRLN